ncbi:MAG: DUF2029 domain-containing protein [Bacteroidia bacterium]|nr:DUF2029 domain-containing protein [Bacteroidia bacterium]
MNFWKLHKIPIIITILSIVLYLFFAYTLERTDFVKLVGLYSGLFILFYFLKTSVSSFRSLLIVSVLLRLIFLVALPNLSQDFYRFIWDGRLLLEGVNPYVFTPEYLMEISRHQPSQAQELISGMGSLSAGHFSNYPPLNQLCFAIASLFTGKSILGSVVALRIIIISADIGTLYFGKKLLDRLQLPAHNIFWYILNPFIIIELTGNLHFEGVMIFLLVWSLYLLHSGKWIWSAIMLSASISIKLIPLIFLPLFFQKLGWKKSLGYYSLVGIITVLLFIPFYSSEFIGNYAQTVGLWFQKFEFNASIYYLARWIGFSIRGWNEIAIIGKILPAIVVIFVLALSIFRKNKSTIQLIAACLLAISFYYFTSTTVHPWYLASLLILSVFTNYKFPLVWSFVIILSYLAYIDPSDSNTSENLCIIALEYLVVYCVFVWEVFLKKRPFHSRISNSD